MSSSGLSQADDNNVLLYVCFTPIQSSLGHQLSTFFSESYTFYFIFLFFYNQLYHSRSYTQFGSVGISQRREVHNVCVHRSNIGAMRLPAICRHITFALFEYIRTFQFKPYGNRTQFIMQTQILQKNNFIFSVSDLVLIDLSRINKFHCTQQ